MKWRRVATGFIEVIKEERSHIVLFKRSEKVNSYQGRWASISGSIELMSNPIVDFSSNDCYDYQVGEYFVESPMECAFREIQEETQLKVGKDLKFIRSGRPQYLPLNEGKGFIVYPFLFRLAVENSSMDIPCQLENLGFSIDWEHDSFKVFETEQFLRKAMNDSTTPTLHETVPNLRDTLHRLYFVYGLENELLVDVENNIVNNFSDGATTIALKTIDIMKKALNVFSSIEVPDYFKLMNSSMDLDTVRAIFLISKLRDIVWILDQCRMEMPMISNVAIQSLVEIMQNLDFDQGSITKRVSQTTYERMLHEMKERLNNFSTKITNNTQVISNKFQRYIQSEHLKENTKSISILTHSWSSVVIKTLKDLILEMKEKYPATNLNIYVTESQPEKEGFKSAQALKDFSLEVDANLKVQVCTEASIGFLSRSRKIDLICVGTDSIHSHHGEIVISNKTGTSVLYSISRFHNIPFVVLSDTMKITRISEETTSDANMDDSLVFKQPLFEHFTLVNDPVQTRVLLEIDNSDLCQIQTTFETQRFKIFGK